MVIPSDFIIFSLPTDTLPAVDVALDTVARNLVHVLYTAIVMPVTLDVAQCRGYGMVGVLLHMGHKVEQVAE